MESIIEYTIYFYGERDAYINVINKPKDYPEEYDEIFLFCVYAFRQVYNIGQTHPVCISLGKSLSQVKDGRHPLLLTITNPKLFSTENPLHEMSTKDIRIIGSSPKKVDKGFSGKIQHEGRVIQHILNPQGFNFLGYGIPYYAPLSVGLLLNYLAQRPYDDKFVMSLSAAARACGEIILSQQVTALHLILADKIAKSVFS